ncbi:MAG: hypothetical protein EOP67_59745, partial [Sphingomonas sp.]
MNPDDACRSHPPAPYFIRKRWIATNVTCICNKPAPYHRHRCSALPLASGDRSTSFGDNTIASGDFSTAMGTYSIAAGDYSRSDLLP